MSRRETGCFVSSALIRRSASTSPARRFSVGDQLLQELAASAHAGESIGNPVSGSARAVQIPLAVTNRTSVVPDFSYRSRDCPPIVIHLPHVLATLATLLPGTHIDDGRAETGGLDDPAGTVPNQHRRL